LVPAWTFPFKTSNRFGILKHRFRRSMGAVMRVGEQSGMVFPVETHLSTPKIALASPPTPQHAKTALPPQQAKSAPVGDPSRAGDPGIPDHAPIERDENPGIMANRLQKRRGKIF
jgi:hypothetical protein